MKRRLSSYCMRAAGFMAAVVLFGGPNLRAQCTNPPNAIVAENCQTGAPQSQWDVSQRLTNAGDPSIQGFASDISVNAGQTVSFKIKTPASQYRLDIYRMGYYNGAGARKITTVTPSATLPQSQPACVTDSVTQLYDCGNWAVSASWAVPANAVSGIYFAHVIRPDTGGDSHIFFIVRNDAGHSDLLFQTSDETWQAYNDYGGHSLYGPGGEFNLSARGYKVSYNRPFNTRQFEAESWIFNAEYPMVRWLEANGYDVSYFTGVDAARNGALIRNHKVYLSVGHDEYVSGPQRSNVEGALGAGVNLAFFSGNEWFWKTRWENAIDGSGTPYRTMVCYKETLANAKLDPADPPTWTGTWRDPRFSPPADGGKPENALTGTLFQVNGPGDDNSALSITVPAADGKMRFWRNTSIATQSPGQTATLPVATLGYEWDADVDDGFRPAGLVALSTTTRTLTTDFLQDYGGVYGAGTATHRLSLYRAASGALVFGAGTVQWSWGLDDNHDAPISVSPNVDSNMQQATVNLFADMGVQPTTLQPGLTRATASTDTSAPSSSITAPAAGAHVSAGQTITISGTAADQGGGRVGAVEVSVDGGITWHPAVGRENWTYAWAPAGLGTTTIKSRAVDDSANLEAPGAGISVTVDASDCPCGLFGGGTTPAQPDSGDPGAVQVGVKFYSDYDGFITGIRFYKSAANTGTHVGYLWSASGAVLASATFSNETASGWQQVSFSQPVAITARTTYVAGYFAPSGHYSVSPGYFTWAAANTPPLHAPVSGNGVFAYGPSGTFPTSTYAGTNYFVDVVYAPSTSLPGAPPSLLTLPSGMSFSAAVGQGSPVVTPPQTLTVYNQGSGTISWTATTSASWLVLSSQSGTTPANVSVSVNPTGLAPGNYQATITVTPPAGQGSTQTIPVSLTVTNLLLSSPLTTGTPDGWLLSPQGSLSTWSIVNQALQNTGSGPTQLYTGNSAWGDYTFQTDIKLSSLSDYPGGIRARVNPANGASYMLWLYPAEGVMRLYRTVGWDINLGVTQLGSATVAFDAQQFHRYTLSFSGTQIQVLFDGAPVITVNDATNATGLIALDVYNQPLAFKNVLVTSGTATTASLTATPTTLNFTGTYPSGNPAAQTVSLTNAGTGGLVWTASGAASWLTLSAAGGVTPSSLQLTPNVAGLSPGQYTTQLTVSSLASTTVQLQITVNLTVAAPSATLSINPGSLNFSAIAGQPNPPAQSLNILNGGFGPLNWTAASTAAWLTLGSNSGTTPAALPVSVNASGLALGTYNGTINVSASGASNSPQAVPVSMTILAQDLNETFANQAAGWVISPMGLANGWSVANGVYTFNGSGLSQSCAGNGNWTDYTFDTQIKLPSLANWPGGVRARVNPGTGAGYALWLYPGNGPQQAILYKTPQWNINGPGLVQLAQAPLTLDTATHTLRLKFTGTQIIAYWDGTLLLSATDATYASGFVCLDGATQPISYSNIVVNAIQPTATLAATPTTLTFAAQPGSAPITKTVALDGGGAASAFTVTTSAPWLSASISSTVTPATLSITANPAGLGENTYSGTVTVTSPGATNSPLTIPVTFGVKTALLATSPGSLIFFGSTTTNPSAQSIAISNSGSGALNWTASADSAWIGLSPASGTAPGNLSVVGNTSGLAVGTYNGNVTISSPDAGNGPSTIPVSMQVGTSLFSDNFSAGATNWTISPQGHAAGWSVSNGVYQFNGQGPSQAWAGSNTWTDYTVAVDVQLSSLSDWPGGIRGRVDTATGASYSVWIYPNEQLLRLYRFGVWDVNAQLTKLAEVSVPLNLGVHNFRMSFVGTQIKVYYDQALVMQATDATYTHGAIALDVYNQPISFKNVSVIGF